MRTFPLFCFSDGYNLIATRGENDEQAMSYAAWSPQFPRGVTISCLDYCPIDLAKQYSTNHAEGWLYRAPEWLQKQEREKAVKEGLSMVMDNLFDNKKEILLYEGGPRGFFSINGC